jgi:7-carboxy-7-deazaguanine synthase
MIMVEHAATIDTPRTSVLDTRYRIMEHFHTIQGEGVHGGRSAYFIRTGGCDVRCWWCDVKDSWEADIHPEMTVTELVKTAAASNPAFVVITGGEPLMHDLRPLTQGLHEAGLKIHLETSGSSPMLGEFDWITLSPKRFKLPLEDIYAVTDELKVVVLTKKDLQWAEQHANKCGPGARLLLQPEWDTPKSLPLIIDYVKANPKWGISLQTHKFMQIP